MAKHRIGRINDEVQKEVASALREVKDPRVEGAFVSVTGADVTPDLKYAKIYYSALRGDAKEVALINKAMSDKEAKAASKSRKIPYFCGIYPLFY